MLFDATSFQVDERGMNTIITISFDLKDETIIDPTKQVVGSTTVSMSIPSNLTAAAAKTLIAQNCKQFLQDWYNVWKAHKQKVVDFLTSNETQLETYLNTNITF